MCMHLQTDGELNPVFCTIVPPHVLDHLSRSADARLADPARRTLAADALSRDRRRITALAATPTRHTAGAVPRQAAAHPVRLRKREPPCRASRSARRATSPPPTPASTARTPGSAPPSSCCSRLTRRSSIDGRGPPADRLRALRPGVQQRVLRRRADGLRGRRRRDLPRLHRRGRRDRPRAGPRPHPVHRQSALRGPVGRAQRVRVRRDRLPGQAVLAGPERRAGRLADRRRTRSRPGSAGTPCAR